MMKCDLIGIRGAGFAYDDSLHRTINMNTEPISTSIVFVQMIGRAIRWGFLLGLVCGMIAGLPVFGIGALFGMAPGVMIGMAAGVASGFGLTIVSLLLYNPLRPEKKLEYRIVAALVCIVISFLVAAISLQRIFYPTIDITSY